MAWNGTVTCSWCYRQGHNRRSCESLKDRYQEALAKSEEERGHSDNSIIREVTYSKTYHRERKCTYCKTVGHNRRGCEMLKAHKDYVFRQDVAFKKAFLQECNEIGLGVGAFTPIINTPEVAILGIGSGEFKPNKELTKMLLKMPICLSYDHRIIDGADGARFAMEVKNQFETITESEIKEIS